MGRGPIVAMTNTFYVSMYMHELDSLVYALLVAKNTTFFRFAYIYIHVYMIAQLCTAEESTHRNSTTNTKERNVRTIFGGT